MPGFVNCCFLCEFVECGLVSWPLLSLAYSILLIYVQKKFGLFMLLYFSVNISERRVKSMEILEVFGIQ